MLRTTLMPTAGLTAGLKTALASVIADDVGCGCDSEPQYICSRRMRAYTGAVGLGGNGERARGQSGLDEAAAAT